MEEKILIKSEMDQKWKKIFMYIILGLLAVSVIMLLVAIFGELGWFLERRSELKEDYYDATKGQYYYYSGFLNKKYVDTFDEVDLEYAKAIEKGARSILEPTTEPWGQRTCYIADPEGNLIEIGSFNRPFESKTDFIGVQ